MFFGCSLVMGMVLLFGCCIYEGIIRWIEFVFFSMMLKYFFLVFVMMRMRGFNLIEIWFIRIVWEWLWVFIVNIWLLDFSFDKYVMCFLEIFVYVWMGFCYDSVSKWDIYDYLDELLVIKWIFCKNCDWWFIRKLFLKFGLYLWYWYEMIGDLNYWFEF